MNPVAISPRPDSPILATSSSEPILRAVIAYDHPAAGLRGLRRLKTLLGGAKLELQLAVWPIARLSDEEWHDTILTDLATADLLVLATDGGESWSEVDDTWLGAALAGRSRQTLTVITFAGAEEPWVLTLEGRLSPDPEIKGVGPGMERAQQAA